MASAEQRLPSNAPGPFFVDDSCIDCGMCRWHAPATFGDDASMGQATVAAQPTAEADRRLALEALVSCPTASIGVSPKADLDAVVASFPRPYGSRIRYCGFHAESSFGAASWLIERPGGNVLVDSPRFSRPLARQIQALGGARWMLLTHRDDVADHARWRAELGCERILHARDRTRGTRDVERLIDGRDPVPLADDLLMIPVPGHTAGSMCLLFEERALFTGDHLAFDRTRRHLRAFRGACWYDWPTQIASMEALRAHRFEHVLPGHGAPGHLPHPQMQAELERLIGWMHAGA